jgi:hypothetical protein
MAVRLTLAATRGYLQGEEFVFTGPMHCQVGRSSECFLQLPVSDLSASRHHCLLEIDGPDVQIRDLGSRNGTYINGQMIGCRKCDLSIEKSATLEGPPCHLMAGDELQAGLSVFRVSIEEVAGAADCEAEAGWGSHETCNERSSFACC